MMSMRNTRSTIIELVDDLTPVKPLSAVDGVAYAIIATAISVIRVVEFLGLRAGLKTGHFDPVHVIGSGQFLVLGMAAVVLVIRMSRPQTGNSIRTVIWLGALASWLPLTALIVQISDPDGLWAPDVIPAGLVCFARGNIFSILVFASLIWWLRQGAPTSLERAGTLTGFAAGSFGVFALSLHCASDDIVHIGFWHTAAVAGMAGLGRSIVPPLVRW